MAKIEETKLIKICLVVSALILLIVGFTIGYLYVDKGCMENPLGFGLRQMNDLNEGDDFSCVCTSSLDYEQKFYFNKEFISSEPLSSELSELFVP